MKDFFIQYMGEFITAILAGFAGWLFERKRRHAELVASKADSSQRIMDLYQEALDDLKKRYEERFAYMKQQYDTLKKEMEQLVKQQAQWKRKYQELKNEFEAYKERYEK